MKTPRKGRWIAPTFKRMAKTPFLENSTLATVLVVGLLLVSCGATDSAAGGNGSSSPGNNGTSFTGQHVHIVGSSALQPLAAKAADLFRQQHPEVKIDVQGGGSGVGLSAVSNHQADIGDSDIYADPTEYPDPNLTDHIVCVTPMTMILNPEVNITSLTTQQIMNIYTGVTTNWRDVGGPNLPIVPLVKPTSSGTRALFDKYLLGTTTEVGQPVADASTIVVDTVAHTPGAIGYTSVATINSTIKAIDLDGVTATAQNIQSGKYRFWGFEHMYTLQNGINATTAYLDFMQTPQIQQLAVSLGYLSADTVSNSSGG
jgi:phosphate transport system substrate-binding protein